MVTGDDLQSQSYQHEAYHDPTGQAFETVNLSEEQSAAAQRGHQMQVRERVLRGAARLYARHGWPVFPICNGTPCIQQWQHQASADPDAAESLFFAHPDADAIGVVLGPRSGLVDVECDGPDAEPFAQQLGCNVATPTFQSRRGLHRLFQRPEGLPNKAKLDLGSKLEFRGGGTAGAYSEFPPSGFVKEWVGGLRPTDVPLAKLPQGVVDAACQAERTQQSVTQDHSPHSPTGDPASQPETTPQAASLLAQHWPGPHTYRHDMALALGGVLLRAGIEQATVERLVHDAAVAAGDEEPADRQRAVRDTAERLRRGQPASGRPKLEQYLDGQVVDRIVGLLVGQTGSGNPPSSSTGNDVITNGRGDDPFSLPVVLQQIDRTFPSEFVNIAGKLMIREDRDVRPIESVDTLFATLQGRCTCHWKRGAGFTTKGELYAALREHVQKFEAVERLPHVPPAPATLYLCPEPGQTQDYSALAGLLARFCPATVEDHYLLFSFFATPLWGGAGGARPLFIVESPAGRGTGKSTLLRVLAYLYCGAVWMDQEDSIKDVKRRLLNVEERDKRIVNLDNLKAAKFSWAAYEGLITAPVVSGWKLWTGEGGKPNRITYCISINAPGASRDVAQRSVCIRLARPTYNPAWERETMEYVDANRDRLLAELATLIRAAGQPITPTRWGAWEEAILAKTPDPQGLQAVIARRQAELDVEDDEAKLVEEHFAEKLRELNYDPDRETVHVPNAVARKWMHDALGETTTTNKATRRVEQWHDEGMMPRLRPNPCRTYGRGLLWIGANVPPGAAVHYDLRYMDWGNGKGTVHRDNYSHP